MGRQEVANGLLDTGFDHIDNKRWAEALAVADQLLDMRFSGGFEIAALAHEGLGDLDRATTLLQEGVEVIPIAWPLWLLLAQFLALQGDEAEAQSAFDAAADCAEAPRSWVALKHAEFHRAHGRADMALLLLDQHRDDQLTHAELLTCLNDLGRSKEVVALAPTLLEQAEEEDMRGPIAAQWVRAMPQIGASRDETYTFLRSLIEGAGPLLDLVGASRFAEDRTLALAQQVGVLLRFEGDEGPYGVIAHVRAEGVEDAVAMVLRLLGTDGPVIHMQEPHIMGTETDAPAGVFFMSPRMLIEEN